MIRISMIVDRDDWWQETLVSLMSQKEEGWTCEVYNRTGKPLEELMKHIKAGDTRFAFKIDKEGVFKEKSPGYLHNLTLQDIHDPNDYVAIVEAEDIQNIERLAYQKQLLDSNQHLMATATEAVMIDEKGQNTGGWTTLAPDADKVVEWLKMNKNPLCACSAMFRAGPAKEVGGFDEDLIPLYDLSLWVKLVQAGYFILGVSGQGPQARLVSYRKVDTKPTEQRKMLMADRDKLKERYKPSWDLWKGYTKVPA